MARGGLAMWIMWPVLAETRMGGVPLLRGLMDAGEVGGFAVGLANSE